MANVDRPNGLVPLRHMTGGEIRYQKYKIASGYSANINQGDVVLLINTSKRINLHTDSLDPTTNEPLGVFMGVQYVDTNGDVQFRPNWAASTATKAAADAEALVIDDPMVVYEIQASGTTVSADIGLLGSVTGGGGTPNANGRSIAEWNSADQGTAVNADRYLRLLDIIERPDNDPAAANAKLEVMFAIHAYMQAADAAGI